MCEQFVAALEKNIIQDRKKNSRVTDKHGSISMHIAHTYNQSLEKCNEIYEEVTSSHVAMSIRFSENVFV